MRDCVCVCARTSVCVILFESLFVVPKPYILPSIFSLSRRSQSNDRCFRFCSIRPSVLSFQFAPLVLNRCMGCLYVVLLWISSSGFLLWKSRLYHLPPSPSLVPSILFCLSSSQQGVITALSYGIIMNLGTLFMAECIVFYFLSAKR